MASNSASIKRNDILKLIASAAMLIDHAAMLPGIQSSSAYIIMRTIGRLSFPVFAYYIASGFINTSSLKKYITRLFICAAVSQLPYYLYFKNPYYLNVIFTFLISVAVLYFIKSKRHYTAAAIAFAPLLIEILFKISFDYSTYGVLTVAAFYYFINKPRKAGIAFTVLTVLFCACKRVPIQAFSILSLPIIYMEKTYNIKMPKYFFYYFYPVHLMLLYILSVLMHL